MTRFPTELRYFPLLMFGFEVLQAINTVERGGGSQTAAASTDHHNGPGLLS